MHLVRMKDRGSRGRWHNGARSGEGVKGLQEDESLPGSDERGLGIVDGQVCRGTTSFVRYGSRCALWLFLPGLCATIVIQPEAVSDNTATRALVIRHRAWLQAN